MEARGECRTFLLPPLLKAGLRTPLSDALIAAGALSVDTADADAGTDWERPIFDEPGELPATGWVRARVTALVREDADVPALVGAALREAGVPAESAYEVTRVEDEDWVRRTQAQFVPHQITPGLWIVPSWHEPPDPQAINLVLDPGLRIRHRHPPHDPTVSALACARGGERPVRSRHRLRLRHSRDCRHEARRITGMRRRYRPAGGAGGHAERGPQRRECEIRRGG